MIPKRRYTRKQCQHYGWIGRLFRGGIIRIVVFIGLIACRVIHGEPFVTEHVVLFVIDGPRATEFMDDSTHANIPAIWNDLRPQACISHAFCNNGITSTVPGHASMGAGAYQDIPNDGSERPYIPLLWEYMRNQQSLNDSDVVIIIKKNKLKCLSYSTSQGYGVADSALILGPLSDDSACVEGFMNYGQTRDVVFGMVCLADVDIAGHSGVWHDYNRAIQIADSLAGVMWNWIQSTEPYADRTTMIITADHGRHTDDWTQHGCDCDGCRHLPMIAIGPDFRSGVELFDTPGEQIDIVPTICILLGISPFQTTGRVLSEFFYDDGIAPQTTLVNIEHYGNGIRLSWDPVTLDISGNEDIVWCYKVYFCPQMYFENEDALRIYSVPFDTTFVDTANYGAIDTRAYRIQAIDFGGNVSSLSNIVGMWDYSSLGW